MIALVTYSPLFIWIYLQYVFRYLSLFNVIKVKREDMKCGQKIKMQLSSSEIIKSAQSLTASKMKSSIAFLFLFSAVAGFRRNWQNKRSTNPHIKKKQIEILKQHLYLFRNPRTECRDDSSEGCLHRLWMSKWQRGRRSFSGEWDLKSLTISAKNK